MKNKIVISFLIFCLVSVCFLVVFSFQYSVLADVLPTSAPAEETIISIEEFHVLQTSSFTPYPTLETYPIEPDDPYPIEAQPVSLKEILDMIFGKSVTSGKPSLHK
jgi:hypothetical protein